jgi:hypothetical protein
MRVKPDSLLTEQIPHHRERRDAHDDAAADPVSLQNVILERDTFGVVFCEPRFRSVQTCKDLEMVGIADLLARIHVNEYGHLTIL